jgi:NADH:ubiquinone oxidoreductase subunit 6 (subunit J)
MSILFLSCIFHNALLAISISWTRSPFMSLMFAVLLFINTSIIFLMLGFEFLALINMLVYVGALAVLFLFVIMLLEIPSVELRAYHRGWSPLALFGGLGLTKGFFSDWFTVVLWGTKDSTYCSLLSPVSSIAGFIPTAESLTFVGHAFYMVYADLLILNSLILTIALFGALVLANTR